MLWTRPPGNTSTVDPLYQLNPYHRAPAAHQEENSALPMLKIHEVAKQLDCSVSLLRHLERTGVLPAPQRTLTGHRRYTDNDVADIRRCILNRSPRG